MRANDGGIDSHGRFWVGTMNDPLEAEISPEGVLFRLDPDGSLHRMLEGLSIPNGISWSADNRTMFLNDSPTKIVSAFDFDPDTGSLSNKRVFYRVEDEDGVPDGHAWDAEGCMWQAIFGCGRVVRLNPEGKVVAEVKLPTRCVTCPGFAGEDLYITSAGEEQPEMFPESTQFQGSVFRCPVGVKGQAAHKFRWLGNSK